MIKYNPYNWEIKNKNIDEDRRRLFCDNDTNAVKNFLGNLWDRIDHRNTMLGSMTVNENGSTIDLRFILYK